MKWNEYKLYTFSPHERKYSKENIGITCLNFSQLRHGSCIICIRDSNINVIFLDVSRFIQKMMNYWFFYYNYVHPIHGPRATRSGWRQTLWGYVRKITVGTKLEQAKVVREKHPFGSGFHKVAVRGNKLLEWNLHLSNGIRREWG